jgi:hypothetical protein
MTEDISRFPSLADIQANHDMLLDRREALGDEGAAAASFWGAVGDFAPHRQATGALLDASRDRRAAQSILDYWANALYRAGQPPPEARLADFDPSLAPELPDEPCPYRGLAAFGEADRDFFFGRERLLNDMVERLRDGDRLLAIVGSSGSGKSSVVLAGLLPRLKAGALPGSEGWRYATIVPGSQPLVSLARAPQSVAPATPELDLAQAARLLFAADGFRRDPNYLAATLDETAAAPLVLVVDQFEELFTLCTDADARAAFVGQLLGLTNDAGHPHRVILTMRADFVDNVAKLPDLFPLFRDGRVDVEALDINELRAAIEGPAARVGLKFEEGIVDDLISTILGERAGLPLLQFTLLRLWEKRQRNRVTREVYREVGNPREALERAAEDFWRKLIPEEQETAKRILLRMARPGEGREVTSNRIRRDEVFRAGEARDRVIHVLDRLIHEARLVKLTEGETAADAQIEVAHEALVRNWPRLVGWLDEEREALRRRLRLTAAAEQWERLGKNPDALLRGALLEEAQRQRYRDLNELEMDFVAASQSELEAAEREREAARQRELAQARTFAEKQAQLARRLRRALIALAAFFVATLSAGGYALVQQQQAGDAQATAQAETLARSASDSEAAARALEAAAANATAIAAQSVARGSLATQEAGIVNLIGTPRATPTRSVMYTDTPAAPRTSTPTRDIFITPSRPVVTQRPTATSTTRYSYQWWWRSRPVVTQRPTATATPDIPATATVVALQTQLSAIRATQTALVKPQLYAIIPDITIGQRIQPAFDAISRQLLRAPDRARVTRVTDDLWVEVESPRDGITGWVYGGWVTFDGDPMLLPARLRLRVVTNRNDLPFVYGKVVSFGGAQGAYLLSDAKNEMSGFLWVPTDTEVVVLLVGDGVRSYGSGSWYLVNLVDPFGKNEVHDGWLPKEVIQPR